MSWLIENIEDFVDVKKKDKKWFSELAIKYYFFWNTIPITKNKDVKTIRGYADGQQSVAHIKKSLFKLFNNDIQNTGAPLPANSPRNNIIRTDLTGIEWTPVALMPNILNAAMANIFKTPLSPQCTAIDPIAHNQRLEDRISLKYKDLINAELDEIAKSIRIKMAKPKVMENSDMMISPESLDIDLANDDEIQLYQSMFTKLSVESAMEVCLDYDVYKNKMEIIKQKLLRDQYTLGISVYERFMNEITGLPDVQYYSPEMVYAPYSERPDFTDVPFIFVREFITLEQFIKKFADEITDKSQIVEVFNNACLSYGWSVEKNDFWNQYNQRPYFRQRISIPMAKMYIKTWDGAKTVTKTLGNGQQVTEVKGAEYATDESNRDIQAYWKQCTYVGYFLPFMKKVFGFKRLDASYNADGDESMSVYPICIYKSADLSPVERSMTLIDNFQRAFFKAQHALLKSKVSGYAIDIRGVRNAAANVKEDGISWKNLIEMLFQENILLHDSSNMDESQIMNRPTVETLEGTNMKDVLEYFNIMAGIKQEIREITGINETRDASPPTNQNQSLVGLQQLALQASLNATYYIDDALRRTIEDGYRYAATLFGYILRPENKGTKPYEAIVAYAGQVKAGIIESLNAIPLHKFGIKVQEIPTEAQRQFVQAIIMEMVKNKELDYADLFAIQRLTNYKDAEALIVLRQKKKAMKDQQLQQQQMQIPLLQQQQEFKNKLQLAQTEAQARVQAAQVTGQGNAVVAQITGKINLLLQTLKSQSVNQQINIRHQNTLDQLTYEANLETEKELKKAVA